MPETQSAMGRSIIHHRTPEFSDLFLQTRSNLQKIFRTENDVLILASSGTGAMEASVANLLGPQDLAVAVVAGKFGERWTEMCEAFGIPCVQLSKEYGEAATFGDISDVIRANPGVKALFLQGCETSTATSHDLEEIGRGMKESFPDVVVVVDGITAVGSQELRTDEWGLDVVIGGSQKAFAMSPGLAFMTISPKAIERVEKGSSSRYYFNLAKEIPAQRRGQTAFTPSVTLVDALHSATEVFLQQGLERIVEEAALMAACTRAGLSALDFCLLSKSPANAVTAAFSPEGIDASKLSKRLEERFGIKVAGGQGSLKGKIIRIAHLGYFDLLDVVSVLSAIELCLVEMGRDIELGSSLRAAMKLASQQKAS